MLIGVLRVFKAPLSQNEARIWLRLILWIIGCVLKLRPSMKKMRLVVSLWLLQQMELRALFPLSCVIILTVSPEFRQITQKIFSDGLCNWWACYIKCINYQGRGRLSGWSRRCKCNGCRRSFLYNGQLTLRNWKCLLNCAWTSFGYGLWSSKASFSSIIHWA